MKGEGGVTRRKVGWVLGGGARQREGGADRRSG